MTQERTREHELRTLSERDFSARIPVAWVDRPVLEGDYGIDRQVEIFRDGRPTGLEFYVQLKATDRDLPTALALSLPVKHRDHYPALALPVLMVRHHAPSGRTFARWFHIYDPYYSSRRQTADQKTFTFHWAESDEWTDQMPEKLSAEVEAFRRFRSVLQFPVAFHVQTSDDATVSAAEVMLYMRDLGEQITRVVGLREDPARPGRPTLTFGLDKIIASLGGVSSVTLHRSKDDVQTPVALAGDAFAAIALALLHTGHMDAAARVFSAAGAAMPSLSGSEVAHAAFVAFSYTGRQREAVLLAREIGRRDDEFAETAAQVVAISAVGPTVSEDARAEYRAFLQDLEEQNVAHGRMEIAARARYSIGNSFRASCRPSDALKSYVRAARLHPAYRELAYFNHEVGGMLFILELYSLAAAFYGKAVELGARGGAGGYGFTRALHADALLYAGRYDDAEAAFKHALAQGDVTPEWELKLQAVPLIRNAAGTGTQLRSRKDAWNAIKEALAGEDATSAKEGIAAALRLDALNEDAWYWLALTTVEAEPTQAASFMTAAALARLHDANAWVWAFVLEWNAHQREDQLFRIAAAGRRLAGSEFRDGLLAWVKDQQSSKRDRLLKLLSAADEAATAEKDSFVVRLPAENGDDEILFEFPDGR